MSKFLQNAKKSLGQNFLLDKNILNKIIKIGNVDKNKTVIEIGPGYGHLTEFIKKKIPKKIIAIEKDKDLSSFLRKKFKNDKSIEIINNDILSYIKKSNLSKNIIVFGNLPYNISTQILSSFALLNKWPPWYEILIFMFQKEVADRIIAQKNTKEYSRLTVLSNWRFEIQKHFNISKNSFLPKPKVDSTMLSFRPKKINKFHLKNPKNLETITRVLFSNRRKKINKNLKKLFNNDISIIKNLNLNTDARPSELSNEVYYRIAVLYESLTS